MASGGAGGGETATGGGPGGATVTGGAARGAGGGVTATGAAGGGVDGGVAAAVCATKASKVISRTPLAGGGSVEGSGSLLKRIEGLVVSISDTKSSVGAAIDLRSLSSGGGT
jgi:hypothetical protein